MSENKYIIVIFLLVSVIIGCEGGGMEQDKVQYDSFKDVPASAWKKLTQKKIYFGHQSVGYNIIDGIKGLIKENQNIKLNIVERLDLADIKVGYFAHSRIGKNVDPKSKIDDFSSLMNSKIGGNVDIASYKFCYVDIHTQTDLGKIFNEYKNNMARLSNKYPGTTFIHFTVPLTAEPSGLKSVVKKAKGVVKMMLGRIDMYDNTVKMKFNELLRNEYEGKEPFFDIAKIESTRPDGTRSYYKKNGNIYYSLVPEYTDDGGHLNESGRRIVAEQFLIFLANHI